MSQTWDSDTVPDPVRITPLGWLRVVARGLVLGTLVFGCLAILLLVRLFERPLCGLHRPVTPHITQFVCRNAFRILGMRFSSYGALMHERGAVVANHASWLDIFALNARKRIYFVSKSEVANWPGIGWLARATGTVFIERNPRRAREQTELFQARLMAGHKLLFFPEGTSTDGLRVLPFKTTLFAAFYADALRDHMHIQPVAVIYRAPAGAPAHYYGWWGDMEFGPHLLKTLAAPRQGAVEVHYLPPVRVADFPDRKALAAYLENAIRITHQNALPEAG
ncbi:lysophospholipid acyltransferase family protein [Aestuariivita boseongensis]|uniref:lysophospholipid acyltransferase family protein n=1 Tax=Aestuariivita boseongensis TaxID=1470562 RepID=UPI00067FA872|nr:lysophospholipid acyltransferase family protein [Aestuariivita boseongensis]